jgi:hypothetical protein
VIRWLTPLVNWRCNGICKDVKVPSCDGSLEMGRPIGEVMAQRTQAGSVNDIGSLEM